MVIIAYIFMHTSDFDFARDRNVYDVLFDYICMCSYEAMFP